MPGRGGPMSATGPREKQRATPKTYHFGCNAFTSPYVDGCAWRAFAQKSKRGAEKNRERGQDCAENTMERGLTKRTEINIAKRAAAYSVLDEIVIANDDIFGCIGILSRHACGRPAASWRKCARE